jgi:hypothetical protein
VAHFIGNLMKKKYGKYMATIKSYRTKIFLRLFVFIICVLGILPIVNLDFLKQGLSTGLLYLSIYLFILFLSIYGLSINIQVGEKGVRITSLIFFLNENIDWNDVHSIHVEWPLQQFVFFSKKWNRIRIININAMDTRLKDELIDMLQKYKIEN